MRKFLLLSVAILCFGIYSTSPLFAADSLEEGGLGINPFLFRETVSVGKPTQRTITISNSRNTPLPISVSINDFEPVGKNGQVRFLNSDETSRPQVSLASWIEITSQPDFTIAPESQTSITFTITPPIDAEAGTHYGGLLFSYQTEAEPGSNTTVIRKIAAIIIADLGTAKPTGHITSFRASNSSYDKPDIVFVTNFSNTGNVYLEPKGKIEIKNWFGKVVGLAYINQNAQAVLPHTEREFISEFKKRWLLGRYTATATLSYGNPRLESRTATTFWVLPLGQIARLSAWIIGVIILGYTLLHTYNNWIIKRARK